MLSPENRAARIAIAKDYYRKVDRGDPSFLNLFADDVRFFFPKFGQTVGRAALEAFSARLSQEVIELEHDIDDFNYIAEGEFLVVEGTERGVLRDGTEWPDGMISQGRFCSVFEFDGPLIRRMYIYVDPDFGNQDRDRLGVYRRESA